MARLTKVKLTLFCEFSGEERDARAEQMSAAMLEYDRIEDLKKESAKQYKEQLSALRGEMRSCAKAVNRRGEERPVECVVQFHTPEVGMKTIVRTDTGEVVRAEAMTAEEKQENLFDEIDSINRMFNAPDVRSDGDGMLPPPESAGPGDHPQP